MPKLLYTTHDVSRVCSVYPTTIINWIKEGLLPAYTTPGGHRRIKRDDLIKFIKKNNMPLSNELLEHQKARVLVVDDDVKILRMIQTILKAEEDIEVAIAKSGFEAGVMVLQWTPDLILLDILMPEIDGFEVARKIRQNEMTKDIPIVAVTVLRDEKEKKKMLASGITDYLAKPFKSSHLIEKIRKYLPVRT